MDHDLLGVVGLGEMEADELRNVSAVARLAYSLGVFEDAQVVVKANQIESWLFHEGSDCLCSRVDVRAGYVG